MDPLDRACPPSPCALPVHPPKHPKGVPSRGETVCGLIQSVFLYYSSTRITLMFSMHQQAQTLLVPVSLLCIWYANMTEQRAGTLGTFIGIFTNLKVYEYSLCFLRVVYIRVLRRSLCVCLRLPIFASFFCCFDTADDQNGKQPEPPDWYQTRSFDRGTRPCKTLYRLRYSIRLPFDIFSSCRNIIRSIYEVYRQYSYSLVSILLCCVAERTRQ